LPTTDENTERRSTSLQRVVEKLRNRLTDDELTLLQGGVGSFAVKAIGAGLSFGSHVVLARILGAESFGVYVYALNCANIAVLLGTFGFGTASVRFMAEYISQKRWSVLREYLQYSRRLTAFLSTGISVLFGWGTAFWWMGEPEPLWTFLIAATAIPILAQINVADAELRGLKQVVRAQVPSSVFIPAGLIAGVALAYTVLGVEPTGIHAMSVHVAIAVAGLGLVHWFRRQAMPALPDAGDGSVLEGRRAQWWTTARDMVLISGFNIILLRADTIMVGSFIDPEAAGFYSVASKIAFLLVFGLVAVNSILSPVVSDLYAKGQHRALQNSVRRGAQGAFAFAVLTILGIFLFQDEILQMFGAEFVAGRWAMWALLGGQLVNAFAGPALVLLNMTGHQRVSAWILGVSALLNVALNAILIPIFGLEGAGIATMTTIVVWNGLAVVASKKATDILPIPLSFK
jgi:O-antigen/teichoic acid export membrane protein